VKGIKRILLLFPTFIISPKYYPSSLEFEDNKILIPIKTLVKSVVNTK
jgi:hypothetical protein